MSESTNVLEDKQEIADAIHRYCRSLDRMDRELMASVFHPTGTTSYPKFEGTWMEFVDWVWEMHSAFESHSHQITNLTIGVSEDRSFAVSEAYVTATLWSAEDDSKTAALANAPDGAGGSRPQTAGTKVGVWARYLDTWSRLGGRWGIDHRQCVVDIKTESAAIGLVGAGRRDREDPSYAVLEQVPELGALMGNAH
jgi:hypothetical protein